MKLSSRILKTIALVFFTAALLTGCVSSSPNERPSVERNANDRSPYRSASLTPPRNVDREVPALEDLFGRFHEEEIRIALLLPLSGPSERVGQAFLDAAAMSLFESYDPRLQLFPYDTRGTAEGARQAALEAVSNDVDIVVGPLFSAGIEMAAPIVTERGLKMISFSNNPEVAGNGVYLLSFLPEQEVDRIIAYAAEQGLGRFAALIPDSAYGEAVLEGFSEAVFISGKEITGLEIYERNTEAFFEPVRRIANYDERRDAYLEEERFLKNLGADDFAREILENLEPIETLGDPPFEAILVPESGQFLRSLIPLLPFFEVDPEKIQFLGTGLWYDATLPGEPSLDGAWFAGPDPEKAEGYMSRFRGLYGYRPPRISTLSYDAISLVASLSRIEMRRARFSDETLQNANGFSGIDGIFRFRSDGTVERGYAIVEIRKDGFHVISPGPQSFRQRP